MKQTKHPANLVVKSNGRGAVGVVRFGREILPWTFAPSSLGTPARAAEFRELYQQAKRKLLARERAARKQAAA